MIRSGIPEILAAAPLRFRPRNRPPVLAYHHVGERIPGVDPDLSISAGSFEKQLDRLVAWGFAAVSASGWLDAEAGRADLPDRPVILTFDDGFLTLKDHAFPLLVERGFAATVFVVTGQIGGESAWMHPTSARRPLLGADEMKVWASRGIDFGSHTRSHARLTELGAAQLAEELRGSRDDLAAVFGTSPRTLAYPYGAVDARVRASAADVYEAAFTISEGANGPHRDRHLLQRSGGLERDSAIDLALRLQLGWTPRHRLRHRVRRRVGATRRRLLRN